MIEKKLTRLYGSKEAKKLFKEVKKLIERSFSTNELRSVLTVSPLQIKGEKPLEDLDIFLKENCQDFSTVHLLPFFHYSSDYGFSVIDYKKVEPSLGNWEDIKNVGDDFGLLFDAVINHISPKSEWFEKKDFFIKASPKDKRLSKVVRPRKSPVFHCFNGEFFWTTFSKDQLDLNYQNPKVFLEIVKVLLFYVEKGATVFRIDAAPYLWKKIGTNCIHLKETFLFIELFREILSWANPNIKVLVEANVPQKENKKYLKVSDLVYNFALAPLVIHSFFTGSVEKLVFHINSLKEKDYLNVLSTHDGFPLRPVENILSSKKINELVRKTKELGGTVSYYNKDNPYELNITLYDILERNLQKFLTAHALLIFLKGTPNIYFDNLFVPYRSQGKGRAINRQLWDLENMNFSESYRIIIKLLRIKKEFKGKQKAKVVEPGLLKIKRGDFVGFFNFQDKERKVSFAKEHQDLMSDREVKGVTIPPFGFCLTERKR